MLMVCHLEKSNPEDVDFAKPRIRGETRVDPCGARARRHRGADISGRVKRYVVTYTINP
jgi:urease alpha subunit